MRMMLRIQIDAHAGSQAIKTGAMQGVITGFVERFKPEATYFTVTDGMRSGFFVFDMEGPQQMPAIAEAFFDIGGKVFLAPCMTPDDLQAGFAAAGV